MVETTQEDWITYSDSPGRGLSSSEGPLSGSGTKVADRLLTSLSMSALVAQSVDGEKLKVRKRSYSEIMRVRC